MAGDDAHSIRNVPLFDGLPSEAVDALDAAVRIERHPAGTVLFRQGDPGDALHLLLHGELQVRIERDGREVPIDTVVPPAPVGEIALLTGRSRSATVVATRDATVGVLPAAAFAELVRTHEVLLARVEDAVRPRIRRTRLAGVLRNWFDVQDPEEVRRIEERTSWRDLPSGAVLFEQGDPSDVTWLVVSGRLRVERLPARSGAGPEVMGEVAAGECVGETALLTGEPRSATVRAVRDASLLSVPSDLAQRHPAFALEVARIVADRFRRQREGRGSGHPPRTFALAGLHPGAPVHAVAERVREALEPYGTVLLVDRAELERRFDLPDLADARPGELAESILRDWSDRQERRYDHLLYLADEGDTPWSDRCLRQADQLVLIADADHDPVHAAKREERIRELAPHARASLVLVRPDDRERPHGTADWLDRIAPAVHHHLRLGDRDEAGRLARHLTARAVTVVLSGGGARGYVHIGLLAALEEAGVAIDAVAGTSMGALVGGAYALDRSAARAEASARAFGDPKRIVDRTLPLVAIAKSRGVSEILRAMYGDARIEDLVTPYFCVSSNLSRARPQLHRRGPLWRAVRASSAIPGVFTPVLEEGDVLVDGGAMNNFPVDLARARFGEGPLIASNAYGEERPRMAYAFPDELSGWSMLWDRLRPKRRRRYVAPSIVTTLTQSTSLGAHFLMDRLGDGADLLVRYPTDGIGTLDFDRVDELIRMGREHAARALDAHGPIGGPARVPIDDSIEDSVTSDVRDAATGR